MDNNDQFRYTTDHMIYVSSEEWQQMETEDGDIFIKYIFTMLKKQMRRNGQ